MIRLNVESYCQNCPDFEANVEKFNISSPFISKHQTIIKCEHAARCAEIKRYLEKEDKDGD